MKLPIVGILGKARAGKDTAANTLAALGKGVKIANADKLKQICMELYDLTYEDVYTDEGKNKFTHYERLTCPQCNAFHVEEFNVDRVPHCRCRICGCIGEKKPFVSAWKVRDILQYVGTEGHRIIDPFVWVRYAANTAKKALEDGAGLVAVSDCRFRSECEMIWKLGGEVWRVYRPETDKSEAGIKGHASEKEQESIRDDECQAVIMNDSTLDAYHEKLNAQFRRFQEKYNVP